MAITTYPVLSSDGLVHLLSDARGIYIPQNFAEKFDCTEWSIDADDKAILLEGPEHQLYWDTWNDVEQTAELTDVDGNVWRLMQDGNLWAICYELLTDEHKHNFGIDDDD